jgi:hypothetical protein
MVFAVERPDKFKAAQNLAGIPVTEPCRIESQVSGAHSLERGKKKIEASRL